MTAPAPQSQPTWCPACSREVAGPCHLFNCSIGPHGLTTLTRCQPEATQVRQHTPTPWELIEATEHHGAYVVNSWGRTVCDLYAMSNPMSASVRNGGNSYPVHFDDMEANAAFIVEAVNSHATLQARVEQTEGALRAIMKACVDGRVCDDVAWFDTITTLHDFCDLVLNGPDADGPSMSLDKSGGAT